MRAVHALTKKIDLTVGFVYCVPYDVYAISRSIVKYPIKAEIFLGWPIRESRTSTLIIVIRTEQFKYSSYKVSISDNDPLICYVNTLIKEVTQAFYFALLCENKRLHGF